MTCANDCNTTDTHKDTQKQERTKPIGMSEILQICIEINSHVLPHRL